MPWLPYPDRPNGKVTAQALEQMDLGSVTGPIALWLCGFRVSQLENEGDTSVLVLSRCVLNTHKCRGFKQPPFIISQSCRSEDGKVGLHSLLWVSPGECHSVAGAAVPPRAPGSGSLFSAHWLLVDFSSFLRSSSIFKASKDILDLFGASKHSAFLFLL